MLLRWLKAQGLRLEQIKQDCSASRWKRYPVTRIIFRPLFPATRSCCAGKRRPKGFRAHGHRKTSLQKPFGETVALCQLYNKKAVCVCYIFMKFFTARLKWLKEAKGRFLRIIFGFNDTTEPPPCICSLFLPNTRGDYF